MRMERFRQMEGAQGASSMLSSQQLQGRKMGRRFRPPLQIKDVSTCDSDIPREVFGGPSFPWSGRRPTSSSSEPHMWCGVTTTTDDDEKRCSRSTNYFGYCSLEDFLKQSLNPKTTSTSHRFRFHREGMEKLVTFPSAQPL